MLLPSRQNYTPKLICKDDLLKIEHAINVAVCVHAIDVAARLKLLQKLIAISRSGYVMSLKEDASAKNKQDELLHD